MSKAKLGTAEMKMKTKISKCFLILPKEQILMFENQKATLGLVCGSSLSVLRANKVKKNPYFVWDYVKKLLESHSDFSKLCNIIISSDQDPSLSVKEKSKLYQALVEELVNILLMMVLELCRSCGVALPQSFPR